MPKHATSTDDGPRLTIRPTDHDLTHLAIIAAHLRVNGQPFANRTDAVRHALAQVAGAVTSLKL